MATLMRRMRIEALSQRPRTTRPHPGHTVFPYLLHERAIPAPKQVWAMDITYIPMRRGFISLVAVLDWATRRVLAWRLSNSLTTDFCLDTLEAAIHDWGLPTLLNTDQGRQVPGTAFVGLIQQHGIQLSMDGKGSWRDHRFSARPWKSVTYEEVYLHAYASMTEAQRHLARYVPFYNQGRPPTALDGQTPDMASFAPLPQREAA